MSKAFFSPVKMHAVTVHAISLSVERWPPEGSPSLSIEVNHSVEEQAPALERDSYVATVRLEVTFSVGDRGGGSRSANGSIALSGNISVPKSLSADEAGRAIELNGVALLYSYARAKIADLSALSPMGRFDLPTIDPKEYIRQAHADDHE